MRIRESFTVPEGQKVTEKVFRRVLASSVCSILLCMACLISTTWAWFAVSIDNEGNVIQIADTPKVTLKVADQDFVSGTVLSQGIHKVNITHAGDLDDLHRKSTLYVTLTIDGTNAVCAILNSENNYRQELEIPVGEGKEYSLSYEASWFEPVNARPLVGNIIHIAEETAKTSQETTEAATGPATAPAAATEPVTICGQESFPEITELAIVSTETTGAVG